MAAQMNWGALRLREKIKRFGRSQALEDAPDYIVVAIRHSRRQPQPRLTKAELRQQVAAAFMAWRERQASRPQ